MQKLCFLFSATIALIVFPFSNLTAQESAKPTETNVKFDTQKSENTPPIPVSEISRFVNVYQLIRNRYVEEVSSEKLIDNAIKGMLSELDPYSRYIPVAEMDDFNNENNGSFVGIGITADISDKRLLITSVFKNSPADKAGLKGGDVIREIDAAPVTKQNVRESLDDLKGEIGSKVKLTIHRDDEPSFEVSITRAPVIIPSVESTALTDVNLLHLKINQFTRETGSEARKALSENTQVKGVILDLRNNPGGIIGSALEVADLFLEQGLIVSTKERNTGKLKKKHAKKQSEDSSLPLIVMLNANSASASELVAGALQDHKRALIVGQKSYGKGSVQTIFPTEDNGAIKLTVSRYYTPNGRAIQAKGITPDITLTPLSVKPKLESPDDYYEADLSNHISGEQDKEGNEANSQQKRNANSDARAQQDLELYETINIMKALQFSKKR